jgi:hypothetical protein
MRDEEVNDWEQGVRWLPGTVKRVVWEAGMVRVVVRAGPLSYGKPSLFNPGSGSRRAEVISQGFQNRPWGVGCWLPCLWDVCSLVLCRWSEPQLTLRKNTKLYLVLCFEGLPPSKLMLEFNCHWNCSGRWGL